MSLSIVPSLQITRHNFHRAVGECHPEKLLVIAMKNYGVGPMQSDRDDPVLDREVHQLRTIV